MKKLLSALVSLSLASSLYAGVKATAYKSSIAEESFQTYVVLKALEKLGYETEPIKEVAYAVAYSEIAQNKDSDDILFLPTNWEPLHDNMYKK